MVKLTVRPSIKEYIFCADCRKEHSHPVLVLQAEMKMPIRDVLMEARIFKTAAGMADFCGVSFVSLYNWIKKYYGMSFQQFRRTYICKNKRCYLINIKGSSYSRHDYVLKKLRARHYCACINALEKDHIMTNAPESLVSSILRGNPKVVRITDEAFSVVPKPVKFKMTCPIYFC